MKFLFKNLLRIIAVLVLFDMLYIGKLWLSHNVGRADSIPESRFMQTYIDDRQKNPALPGIKWDPVPLRQIPQRVSRVFIIAEDTHFYVHNGFDIAAIKAVLAESLAKKSISRGASTITQQTAKNLYLYPQRSWLRKWHELIFTLLLEITQSKKRILELYLNIAEFGQGIYGVNAAAKHYFGVSVTEISTKQAAYLAAALPWPQRNNFSTGTKTFYAHANRIYSRSQNETFPTE